MCIYIYLLVALSKFHLQAEQRLAVETVSAMFRALLTGVPNLSIAHLKHSWHSCQACPSFANDNDSTG